MDHKRDLRLAANWYTAHFSLVSSIVADLRMTDRLRDAIAERACLTRDIAAVACSLFMSPEFVCGRIDRHT